jgi:hypothetical protein
MSASLKDFANISKIPSRVLGSVERYVITQPKDTSRSTTVLHPSDIIKSDWCHRSSYFQLLGFPPPPSKYKTSLRQKRVFQLGHDIHAGWQTIFHEMGKLYGKYSCDSCELITWGMGVDPCAVCDGKSHSYKEVSLMYDPLRISGHADGILLGLGEPLLLEIKSVGAGTFRFEAPELMYAHNGEIEAMWKVLKAPFMSHIMQAQMYMKLAELINLPHQPQEALFLYENKASQEPKEFVVKKSDFGITSILDACEDLISRIDAKSPPECNINGEAGCYKCTPYKEETNG